VKSASPVKAWRAGWPNGQWVLIVVYAGANADFRGGIQTEDDGADSCALLIGVVSAAPESAYVAVGVQLAEDCRVAVAGSHDIDTGCALGRPAELYAVAPT
jgi:hypothetical protein